MENKTKKMYEKSEALEVDRFLGALLEKTLGWEDDVGRLRAE